MNEELKLNKEHLAILNHTMLRSVDRLYCGDGKEMKELCANGLMRSVGRKSFVPDEYFTITNKGIDAIAK